MDRFFSRRLHGFAATLIFPLTAVVVEYINTVAFGSWGVVAYTQAGNLPLLQVMSVTGMWGVTFLVMWFGPTVNWIWERSFEWPKVRGGAAIYAGTLAVVMLSGGARLALSPPHATSVRVVSFTASRQIDRFYEAIAEQGYSSAKEMAEKDRASLHELLSAMPLFAAGLFRHPARDSGAPWGKQVRVHRLCRER